MAGEWTVDILREYLLAILDERDKALRAALAASEKAISKAETANERRFDSVNAFRQTLTDQAASFVTREVFDEAMKTIRERQQETTDRVNTQMGKGAGLNAGWLILAAAIPMIIGIIMLVVTLSRT
jgi:CHASE3 domain sensor protein